LEAELKGYADYEEDEIEVESGVMTDVDSTMGASFLFFLMCLYSCGEVRFGYLKKLYI